MSSVIRCELSMRPRSASNESAADDLYALWRELTTDWTAQPVATEPDALDIVPDAT